MKLTREKAEDKNARHIRNLIECLDNLTTSVSFIITALQVANELTAQRDQTIANLQEEVRTLRADLNLRGGA